MDPIIILILLTVIGSITAAVLKWAESSEPFDEKTFIILIVKAVVGGLVSSFAFKGVVPVFPWTYIVAFLVGMGIEVVSLGTSTVGRALGLIQ